MYPRRTRDSAWRGQARETELCPRAQAPYPIAKWPEPQKRQGSDEVRRFFINGFSDAWTDDFASKPETIREHGDAVIAKRLAKERR
jgi:hypothetical protein